MSKRPEPWPTDVPHGPMAISLWALFEAWNVPDALEAANEIAADFRHLAMSPGSARVLKQRIEKYREPV